jgi:MFS family permease
MAFMATPAPAASPQDQREPPGRREPAAPRARATYRSVFAVREFRVMAAAMFMYVLGFEFEILGLSVLVFTQTRSAFWTALAFGAGFAPQAVGGALFTSLADRLPPRLAVAAGLLVRAVPGLVIGLWPALPVPVMLALVAAAATTAPVFSAALSGLLPEVLDGDRYVLGRSVFGLIGSSTQLAGLGAGGALLAAVPSRWLLLAAGGALAANAALTRLGLRPRPARDARDARDAREIREGRETREGRESPGSRSRPRGLIRDTLAGHAELLSDRTIRGLLLAQWLPCWFVTGAESLIVAYTGSLGRPASAAAPLLAAMPAGMLLGDLLAARFCPPAARRRLVFPLAVTMGAPLLAMPFRPPLALAALALLACGAGFAYQVGLQQAFLDSLPERRRGQGFGLSVTGAMGGQGLTPVVTGAVAGVFGAGAGMAIAGAATMAAALALRGHLTGQASGPGSSRSGRPA